MDPLYSENLRTPLLSSGVNCGRETEGGTLLRMRRCFLCSADHSVDQLLENAQSCCGNDNRVAAAFAFFCDSKETASRILLKVEEKSFSFDDHVSAVERLFAHTRFRGG